MDHKRLILFFFLLLTEVTWTLSQPNDSFITNYKAKDYGSSVSNWGVTQGKNGLLFFANLEGFLVFNSKDWKYLTSPGATLSIETDNFDRIYYGTNSDFGYLTATSTGELAYKSLAKEFLPNTDLTPVWHIKYCNGKAYFFTKKTIYEWSGEQLHKIENNGSAFNSNIECLNNNIYIIGESIGLGTLDSTIIKPIFSTKELASKNLISIENTNQGQRLITRDSDVFLVKSDSLHRLNKITINKNSPTLRNQKKLLNGNYAFSTLNQGILILDSTLSKISSYNKSNGLQSNSVKDLLIENNNNIWTALQEGISLIEYGCPLKKIVDQENISGIILTSGLLEIDGNLIIATTESAYSIISKQNQFIKIINESVWSLASYRKSAIISTLNKNHLLQNDSTIESVLPSKILLSIQPFGENYLVNHRSGICIVKPNFELTKNIELGDETWIDTAIDSDKNTWSSAKYKGIYRINNIHSDNPKVDLFNTESGLPDVKEIHLIKHQNQLLFTTSKGLYQYVEENPDSTKFVPYQGDLNPLGHLKEAVKDSDGNYYFTIQEEQTDRLEKFEPQPDGSYKRVYKPFRRLPDMEITAILPDKDSILWIAGTEGLFKFDEKVKKDYDLPFYTLISQVSIQDSLIFGGFYSKLLPGNMVPAITLEQPNEKIPKLEYKNNNLTFNYAAAFYELPEKTEYSYFLKNNDQTWSKWSTETKKEYTNLPAGEYTFMVKSKNIYDTIGHIATYEFTILPPWYQTTWAYIGFAFLSILFIWFISLAYTYRVRMQRRKLKLIVADRTFEVISQKKEIEQQNQLLKTQYGEISSQKDEIEMKNSELQQSQEEILTINEKLKELNSHLEKKVEQRTQKIKTTLIKLKKTNKELDTFIYRASHDLKGPISRIHGLTSLAKLETKDASNTKYYDLIEHAALDMQGLLSKLSHAYEIMNKEVIMETIDIPFLLSEIRNAVKFLDQGTKYSFDIQEKLSLRSDKYLLKIILENVIENALIFRKKDSNHEVSINCYEENDNFYFQIADNGIGVNPDHSLSIFEMFFRGSDQSKGSGLGLYITKLALEKIRGSIEVESTLYQYSKFTITIPLS